LLFSLCSAALVGCEKDRREEEIMVEEVTHPGRQPIRLRAACIKRDDVIWFFRILGPVDEVGKHVKEFDELVRSAKFEKQKDKKAEKIILVQPKDWRKDPAGPPGAIRQAGYRIDAKPKELEVTVIKLPAGEDWLISNVARWQKIVNEPPVQDREALEKKITREGEIVWVDLTGLGVHTVSKPPEPLAAANPKRMQFPLPGQHQPRGLKSAFKYEAPKDWQQTPVTKPFMADRYEIGDDVQVSLTSVGGSLVENVNRWRTEVGLPGNLNEAEAARLTEARMVAGLKAYYVDISNPAGPPEKNRSLAVTIPMDKTNWFIKMWGPKDSVEKNKVAFDKFVESFKLDAR
jgi:hypothetical protein